MEYIAIGFGIGMGVFGAWMHFRIRLLEEIISAFPTPQEMAVEVMKANVPISELPPELQEQIQSMKNPKPPVTEKKDNYIG